MEWYEAHTIFLWDIHELIFRLPDYFDIADFGFHRWSDVQARDLQFRIFVGLIDIWVFILAEVRLVVAVWFFKGAARGAIPLSCSDAAVSDTDIGVNFKLLLVFTHGADGTSLHIHGLVFFFLNFGGSFHERLLSLQFLLLMPVQQITNITFDLSRPFIDLGPQRQFRID